MYVLVETGGDGGATNTYQFTGIDGLQAWVKERVNDTSGVADATLLKRIGDMISEHYKGCEKKEKEEAEWVYKPEKKKSAESMISDEEVKQKAVAYFVSNFCETDEKTIRHSYDLDIVCYAFLLFLLNPGDEHKNIKLHTQRNSNIAIQCALSEAKQMLGFNMYKLRKNTSHALINAFYNMCYRYSEDHIFYEYNVLNLFFMHIHNCFVEGKDMNIVPLNIKLQEIYASFVKNCIRNYGSMLKGDMVKSSALYNVFIEFLTILYPTSSRSTLETLYTKKALSMYLKSVGIGSTRKSEGVYYTKITITGSLSRMNMIDTKDGVEEGDDGIVPYNSDMDTFSSAVTHYA